MSFFSYDPFLHCMMCVCDIVYTSLAADQVKETRKAVKDSHTGLQKMAVGHHIGQYIPLPYYI